MTGENPNKESLSDKFDRHALTIPTIYEDDEHGRRMGYDIFSRMMKDGVVYLNGPVNGQSAAILVAQLQYLDRHYDGEIVTLNINSPGGSVTAGLSIYDTMMRMNKPVRTICSGQAASMGSFLLMAGAPGERFALPNSEVMIHEGAAGKQGKISDMDSIQQMFNNTNNRLFKLYEFHTGMDYDDLKFVMERKDTFMNAEEAKVLGLVDHIDYTVNLGNANDNFTGDKLSDDEKTTFGKFKEAWGKFVAKLNVEEGKRRGQPSAPSVDDNLMEIGKKRKAPKFG